MKKWIAAFLILVCLVSIAACSGAGEKGKILLKDGAVKRISVTSMPGYYDYSFEDGAVQPVVRYLSELNLTADFPEDPDLYAGMTWVISLEYEDGEDLTIYHFGNMFIRTAEGPWYKMTYEEAERFGSLLDEPAQQDAGLS